VKNSKTQLAVLFLSTICFLTGAYAQITPSADAYTNTADPTTNYGANVLLDVDGATQITYIHFNLASIPPGASISQATLKLYVNAVTTAGSFNVDYVNGTWEESTITSKLAPALGAAIVSSVPITTADTNQYILINITPAVVAWLNGSVADDGIALVADSTFHASFDSKENTTTSHPAELDIVSNGNGAQGPAGPTGPAGPIGPTGATGATGSQGPSGPLGPQGPTGPAGIINLGSWTPLTQYVINDSVSYNGSSWIALAPNSDSAPNPQNTNWQLLAAEGINNQGSWVSTVTYQVNDAVTDGGQYWLALAPNSSSEPAITNRNWQLIAAAGAAGAAGSPGAQGPAGATGATGATGPQGPIGITGAQGPAGATGSVGPAGAVGPQGPQGTTGTAGPGGLSGLQLFTTTGTTAFVVPSNVTNVIVELVGGGGAGSASDENGQLGAGGGGGAYTKAFVNVTPGATYNIVVGVGGIGQDLANGLAGTTNSFSDNGGNILAYASGGGGGFYNEAGPGGSNAGNLAIFASPGNNGTGSGPGGAGVAFVPNGQLFGAGGGGAGLGSIGLPGGAGAVLLTY
jgi:hypothetical protein